MRIFNPLYDTTFKFLMEDLQAAKDFIGIILGTEVVSLDPQPQETTAGGNLRDAIRAYRMDYKAVICDAAGARQVILVEIQKYNPTGSVYRFRQYLSSAYLSREVALSADGEPEMLPIVTIYILGERLTDYPCSSIRIEPCAFNNVTGEPLSATSRFVQLLTHRCFILMAAESADGAGFCDQSEVPELELLRSLFVQRQRGSRVINQALDVDSPRYVGRLESIVRRLHLAALEESVLRTLTLEEEVLERELGAADDRRAKVELEREKMELERQREEERQAKEEALRAKEEALQAKEEALQAQDALAQSFARTLLAMGVGVEEVAVRTGLSVAQVRGLLG